jgi:hypothetical protein
MKRKKSQPIAKTDKKEKSHLFKRGQSGNPKGRPQGSRNRVTIAAQALLDGQAEKITQKAIDKALEGDGMALRLCLERLLPVRKDCFINLSLPKIESIEDTVKAMAVISKGVSDGKVTPGEGQILSGMVENYRKAMESTELERRLTELEEKAEEKEIFKHPRRKLGGHL